MEQSGKVAPLPLEDLPGEEEVGPPPLEDDDGDDVMLVPKAAPQPKKRRRTPAPPLGGRGKGGGKAPLPLDDTDVQLEPPSPPPPPVVDPAPPPPPPPPPPVEVGPPPPEEDCDDVVLAAPEDPAPRPPPAPGRGDRWFDGNGYRVRWGPDYVTPKGVRFSANWMIKCGNPLHNRCFKKRHASEAHMSECGEIEPLAFLHAWAELELTLGEHHPTSNPAQHQTVAYANAHGDELRAVIARKPDK